MTLVTTASVALAVGAAAARPASATPAARANGAELAPEGAVISLSVVPAAGRADVVIGINGAVTVQDFTLRNPDKIVVDVTGASLGLPNGDYYDRVARGGIVNVRYSQYRRNVVRVVLTLDGQRPYAVVTGKHEVRVSVEGRSEKLDTWHVGRQPDGQIVAAAPTAREARAARATPENTVLDAGGTRRVLTEMPSSFALARSARASQPRITIAWENADIHDVLAAFAAFAGRTIIPAKDVTGKVTAEITNQPWDIAMRAILNANGFDAVEDPSGIIIVDTFEHLLSRQAAEPLATRTVRLNYSRSSAVALMLFQRLSRECGRVNVGGGGGSQGGINACAPRGAVTADSLTNSVSFTDIPSNLDALEDYTRSLDVRQPQVNIKAKIILVDRSSLEGLGLRYDLGGRTQFFNDVVQRFDSNGAVIQGGRIDIGGNTVAAIANSTARIPASTLQLVYSTAIGGFDFTTFLEALQQSNLLDVQAEPSASVLNNRTANLTAGTQVPIRVIDASAGGNTGNAFPRATVRIQETGVILNVTPQVTNNRQVQMRVHVENSDVQFEGGDVGAVFPRQSVDNEVLVADGETAVMGGLTQTTVRTTKSGIPILVDLPLIGRLFGVTQRQETKRDLLILITPHIIDDGQSPSDQSR